MSPVGWCSVVGAGRVAGWLRGWRVAVVALVLGVAGGLLAPGAAWAITPAEYREVIAGALAVVEAASEDEAGQTVALGEVGRRLEAAGQVELPSGQTVAVANPPLRAALERGDLAAARGHLAALLGALDTALAARDPAPDAAARLAAVLALPEFRPPESGLLQRLFRPLLDYLDPILEPLRMAWERFWRGLRAQTGGTTGDGERIVWLVLGVLVVIGVAALLAGALTGNVVSRAQIAAARAMRGPGAATTRTRALGLAEARQYRAAIHELYLATLLRLDERGLLRFQPSLTNREHLARDRVSPAVAPVLTPLVEGYDRLWYGGVPATTEDWQRFVALADAAWQIPARGATEPRDQGKEARDGLGGT